MNPHWLLKRVAELEKNLVTQERLVAAYQIIVNDEYSKRGTKEEKKRLKENTISIKRRLKKLEAKAELLNKVPELEIAYRSSWEEYA